MRASLIIAEFLVSAPPRANTAEAERAYFTGKTVRMIVGYGPGGGYDAYARMISPYLGKFLGATILVENQPGAGGLIALNRIYAAPPDGLLMMLVNGTGAAMSQLTEQSLRSQPSQFSRNCDGVPANVDGRPRFADQNAAGCDDVR